VLPSERTTWLDLAKGRLRLDRLAATALGRLSSPGLRHSSRTTRKSHRRHPPLLYGPKSGASSIAFGLQIAIEAPMVAGSNSQGDMANIGTFKKSGQEFQGEIRTLSVQANGVRVVLETNRANDNAPSHRVFVGRAEIGAAWSKRSSEGRDYLSVKLDDPSFTAPIYANLFEDAEGGASPSSGPAAASRTAHIARHPIGLSPARFFRARLFGVPVQSHAPSNLIDAGRAVAVPPKLLVTFYADGGYLPHLPRCPCCGARTKTFGRRSS
jgi:uncharacterized protein (DUF736 family)